MNIKQDIKDANEQPLDPEEFLRLLGIGHDAFTGKSRIIPPDSERCLEDLPLGTLALTDIPENQMGLTLARECGDDKIKFKGFMMRWFALMSAKSSGVLDEFTRPAALGMIEVNDAVFRAAAVEPLNSRMRFNLRKFKSRIKRLIKEKK